MRDACLLYRISFFHEEKIHPVSRGLNRGHDEFDRDLRDRAVSLYQTPAQGRGGGYFYRRDIINGDVRPNSALRKPRTVPSYTPLWGGVRGG